MRSYTRRITRGRWVDMPRPQRIESSTTRRKKDVRTEATPYTHTPRRHGKGPRVSGVLRESVSINSDHLSVPSSNVSPVPREDEPATPLPAMPFRFGTAPAREATAASERTCVASAPTSDSVVHVAATRFRPPRRPVFCSRPAGGLSAKLDGVRDVLRAVGTGSDGDRHPSRAAGASVRPSERACDSEQHLREKRRGTK